MIMEALKKEGFELFL